MKKFFLFLSVGVSVLTCCVIEYSIKTPNSVDLELISVEALSRSEAAPNFGPAKVVDCTGKQHKKICMCEPGYPECTETECF